MPHAHLHRNRLNFWRGSLKLIYSTITWIHAVIFCLCDEHPLNQNWAEQSSAQHSSGKANTWNPKRTVSVGINAVSMWCNWKEKEKENHSVSTIIKVPATTLMSIAPYTHTFIKYVFIRSYRISQFLPCTDKINEGEYIDRTHIYVLQYRFICAYAYRLVSFFFVWNFSFFLYVAASNEP